MAADLNSVSKRTHERSDLSLASGAAADDETDLKLALSISAVTLIDDHSSDYMFALARSDLSLAIDAVNLIVEAAAVELTVRRTITAAML